MRQIVKITADDAMRPINDISKVPIIDGNLLKDVNLIAGQDNVINHGLNRGPLFWMLARINAQSTVWEIRHNLEDRFLKLRCSANCTVNLWVG
jgi:hypothetical protein